MRSLVQNFVKQKNLPLLITFFLLANLELIFIHQQSDLNIEIGNWIAKSTDIVHFRIPEDNFYGPGAAILLAPFLFLKSKLFLVIIFYFNLALAAYWKIIELIPQSKLRIMGLSLFLSNFYLFWLVNSSQDTVFELFLLLWSVYFLMKRRYLLFSFFAFLLCETRAGYWTFFLGTGFAFVFKDYLVGKKFNWKRYLAFPFVIFMLIFNVLAYGSPSPSLEGGITAYFSYTKYHYLSLPKMDMDVFLSGKNGAFSEGIGPSFTGKETQAEKNSIYFKAAVKSIEENPKETLLGWMQKFDSYVFEAQKVPHLPGSYVLDQKKGVIEIGDERLRWPLVIGNFVYMIYRSVIFVALLLSLGAFIQGRIRGQGKLRDSFEDFKLLLPWVFGIIPAVLIYSETRFKIVSEILIIPFVLLIISKLANKTRTNS